MRNIFLAFLFSLALLGVAMPMVAFGQPSDGRVFVEKYRIAWEISNTVTMDNRTDCNVLEHELSVDGTARIDTPCVEITMPDGSRRYKISWTEIPRPEIFDEKKSCTDFQQKLVRDDSVKKPEHQTSIRIHDHCNAIMVPEKEQVDVADGAVDDGGGSNVDLADTAVDDAQNASDANLGGAGDTNTNTNNTGGSVTGSGSEGGGRSVQTGKAGIRNPLGNISSIPALIKALIDRLVIPLGTSIVVLAIIYSGFKFVVAQGNPEKLKEAKRALLWTLIGGAVLLGSWTIALIIENTIKELRVSADTVIVRAHYDA